MQINPRVTAEFTGQGSRMLHYLEEETGKFFHFEGSEGLALDHFAISCQGTREEVEARALPFREGDEVLVEIVEPHMYDVDEAVAKIDGYIISVAAAAGVVGQKRLVRIDEVGRTAATALLLDDAGEVIRSGHGSADGRRTRPTRRASSGAARSDRLALRRSPADSEDAEARSEAGLSSSPTAIDSEPEDVETGAGKRRRSRSTPKRLASRRATAADRRRNGAGAAAERPGAQDGRAQQEAEGDEGGAEAADGLKSQPRRRGRRGAGDVAAQSKTTAKATRERTTRTAAPPVGEAG